MSIFDKVDISNNKAILKAVLGHGIAENKECNSSDCNSINTFDFKRHRIIDGKIGVNQVDIVCKKCGYFNMKVKTKNNEIKSIWVNKVY